VLLPQFLQLFMGYSAEEAGMTLSPGALSIILFMPVIGILVSRVQARYLIAFGFAITAFALYQMTHINLHIDFRTAVIWRIYQSAGMAFLFIPINTAAYLGIPKEKNNDVSGLLNLARNVGGSMGISFVATFIARNAQKHQDFLVAHATPFDAAYRSMITGSANAMTTHGLSAVAATRAAEGRIFQQILAQAQVLAYGDALTVMAIAAVFVVPLCFLMKKNDPHEGGAMAH
jgi:DHA2 family multidrug resistance protein